MNISKLFTPYNIGKCEIPNRLVVSPMVVNMNADAGKASEQFIKYHEEKAKGGWGLIITEDYRVSEHAGGYPYIGGLYDEAQIPSHRKFTDTIHQYDSKVFCQIYHAGRQANRRVNGGAQPVSCSPIPCPWNKEIPRELSIDEIREIVDDFGKTAANVVKAGFDGVEIHAAHGYLIHQFLSVNSNKRIDEYGGSYENRTRFLREVMESVRKAVGPDFPVQVRISVVEYAEGGRSMYETHEILKDIEAWGADSLHMTFSMYGTRSSVGSVASFYQSHGFNVHLAEEAKKFINIPVITVGRIQEPRMAEEIIAAGKADFVAMGRASLTDPHYPNKVKAGDFNDIRECIGCLQGCTASTYQGVPVHCLVNPELGHEYITDYSQAPVPKKVFVAGGGVGGMEAARAAAMKGHDVSLYETSDKLGGSFTLAAYPPNKGGFITYPAWLNRQLRKLGVSIKLNTALTAEMVRQEKPDKVIIATGSEPIIPDVPGIGSAKVVLAEDVLSGRVDTGMDVLVVGGGMVGSETAAFLSTFCKASVGLVEMRPDIGLDMEGGIRDDLKDCLNKFFVKIMTRTTLVAVTDGGALLEHEGATKEYPCDTVVLAVGTRARNLLEEGIKGICDVVVIGDALEARKAINASREGFVAGIEA